MMLVVMCYREDIEHIFRGCLKAKNVWLNLGKSRDWIEADANFVDWLDENLNDRTVERHGLNWNILFANTLWCIWKTRNGAQFNNKIEEPDQIAILSTIIAEQAGLSFESNLTGFNVFKANRNIVWNPPDIDEFKCNTDGGVDDWDRGSIGGLFRNQEGKWIEGFCGMIGTATVIRAELWAIRQALKIMQEKDWEGVRIETDSLLAIRLIEGEEDRTNPPDIVLIEDCRELIRDRRTATIYTPREANKCADMLGKIGAGLHEQLVRMMIPPAEIFSFLKKDMADNM